MHLLSLISKDLEIQDQRTINWHSQGGMGKIESQKDSQISRRYKESRTCSVIQKPHRDDNVTCSNNEPIQSQGHSTYEYNITYYPHLKAVSL